MEAQNGLKQVKSDLVKYWLKLNVLYNALVIFKYLKNVSYVYIYEIKSNLWPIYNCGFIT
jgi:hypothetical protein